MEKQIEVIRQLLCELPRFHPYSTFKSLSGTKGLVDEDDVGQLLIRNGFSSHQSRIYIRSYDQDRDGALNYAE